MNNTSSASQSPQLIPQLFGVGSGQPKHWNSLRPRQLQHRSDINLSTELAGRSAGWLVGTEPGGRGESATQTAKSGEAAKQPVERVSDFWRKVSKVEKFPTMKKLYVIFLDQLLTLTNSPQV